MPVRSGLLKARRPPRAAPRRYGCSACPRAAAACARCARPPHVSAPRGHSAGPCARVAGGWRVCWVAAPPRPHGPMRSHPPHHSPLPGEIPARPAASALASSMTCGLRGQGPRGPTSRSSADGGAAASARRASSAASSRWSARWQSCVSASVTMKSVKRSTWPLARSTTSGVTDGHSTCGRARAQHALEQFGISILFVCVT